MLLESVGKVKYLIRFFTVLTSEQFNEFRALMKNHVGEEAYSKMSDKELMDSVVSLLALVRAV